MNTYEIHTDIPTNQAHQTLHFPGQSDFLVPTGAQEMLMFVYLFVRPVNGCLQLSILILDAQIPLQHKFQI